MTLKQLLTALVLPLMLLACLPAIAQNSVITGKVTDSKDGQPLPGVTVSVKGTNTATQTGADGAFRLTAPAGTTLVISYVGYATQEVAATGQPVNVSLVQTSTSLNDVVVIGYGSVKKKDLTGSVATVTEKDFQKGAISTPEQMISGKVAGVSIISNGGQPGSGSTIRIRGGSSLNASNDPLIVIDGVPLENSGVSGASNPLSFINANDVESFSILKDASASAIYGTRASNGVIIITTKKGKSGALKVNFNSVNSVSAITKEVSVLTGDQVRAVVNQLGTAEQKAMLGTANTDWQKQIYQNALATDNNISISGGIKGLPYRLSIGYLNQNGILKTDNLQKTSVALVLNPVLFDNHLKIDINLKGSVQDTRFGNTGAIGSAIYFDPTKPVYSDSKRYSGYWEWTNPDGSLNSLAGKNPVGILMQRYDRGKPARSIGNIQFDYKFHFLPDLHANVNLGYDASVGKGTIYVPDSAAMEYTRKGENNHYKSTKMNTLVEAYLNYVKDIGKHHVDVTGGYSYNNYLTKNFYYPDYQADGTINPSSALPNFPFDKPENTLISYFGRANYTYAGKYLLTATVRRDGSSRFAPDYRWGTFPSVALAWKLKEESFLKSSNVLSDLKLRLGWGITGQQDGIGNYDYISYYNLSSSTASYQFGNTYYQMYRPGGFYANRKWEQTETSNIGVDFAFLHNRISGSVDVYLKKTKDLLNSVPQPAGTNFAAYILANVGSMENKGIEATLNAIPVQTKDFQWDLSFNVTYNKNTITNLTVVPDDKNYLGFPTGGINGVQGFAFINAVGGPKNTFYLYKQVYDVKTGLPIEGLMYDKNRDGIINENDKFKGKSADPTVFMGFSTNFTYKNWSLGFVTRANINNYVYNNVYSNNGRQNQITGIVIGNASSNYLTTRFAGNSDIQMLSDYYLQNASFLRMDNANLAYNFGKIAHGRATLRVSAVVQNVFVITKYTGLDPEISSGIDNNFYPRPRVYSLGINLGF